jgi:flagellar protein FlaG
MQVATLSSIAESTQAPHNTQNKNQALEKLDQERRESELLLEEPSEKEDKVSPEEILDKIKEISEDGLYSVRFEKHDELNEFIVKVVDRETDEIIKQIPPEEILGFRAYFQELRGNIVDKFL